MFLSSLVFNHPANVLFVPFGSSGLSTSEIFPFRTTNMSDTLVACESISRNLTVYIFPKYALSVMLPVVVAGISEYICSLPFICQPLKLLPSLKFPAVGSFVTTPSLYVVISNQVDPSSNSLPFKSQVTLLSFDWKSLDFRLM